MIKKLRFLIAPSIMFLPLLLLAEDGVNNLVTQINQLIGRLVPTLIGMALLLFLFGVLRYLFSKDGVTQKEAKQFMLWGILALFVMVSVWGLVRILGETIFGSNLNSANRPLPLPSVPQP